MDLSREHVLFLAEFFDHWEAGDELYPTPELPEGLYEAISGAAQALGFEHRPFVYANGIESSWREWKDPAAETSDE